MQMMLNLLPGRSSSANAPPSSQAGSQALTDTLPPEDSMAQRCARGKLALKANLSALSDAHIKLASALVGVGQGHLFESWAPPGIRDDEKVRLLTQLEALDSNYPGGLRAYVHTARTLLLKSKHRESALEGYTAEVPQGITLQPGAQEMVDAERQGYAAMHECALVLLAGGLGERLGYSGIKIALPAEITTGRCYLQSYIDALLALQSASDMAPGQLLPLVIMTSPDTHGKALDLLARNGHFGADPSQILVVMQEQVPALGDSEAHMVLHAEDSTQVLTKPHGHGDVHRLLLTTGTLARLQEQGFKWLYFFQDTNALAMKPLAATLGLSVTNQLDMATMAVPRKPGDACGALMQLRSRADGHVIVNNVEYSEVDGFLRGAREPVDESGHSLYPGNTNQFLVKVSNGCLVNDCTHWPNTQSPMFVRPICAVVV